MRRAFPLAVFLFLSASVSADAHEAINGGGPFINGLFHPFIVPAHVLALIALGLWLGRQDNGALRRSVIAFAVALIVGLVAGPFGTLPAFVPDVLALCIGALAATGWRAPASITVIVALGIAVLIGFDSASEDPLMSLGIWAGAHLIVLNVINIVLRLKAAWLIVGVRVIGAWIAAIALMLLALGLKS